jgi:hypothetical protein
MGKIAPVTLFTYSNKKKKKKFDRLLPQKFIFPSALVAMRNHKFVSKKK